MMAITKFSFTKWSRGSWRRRLLGGLAGIAAAVLCYWWWTYRGPTPPHEIYRGITYSCERLPEEAEGGGLFYLVQVDLSCPGIQLYTTPQDSSAVAQGWEYRLKYIRNVVHDRALAVGINGTIFSSDSGFFHRPGDLARGVETMVSDHKVDHTCVYSYVIWFDKDLNPHLADPLPAGTKLMPEAQFGIGTQYVMLVDGQMRHRTGDSIPDNRTMIAYNPAKKLLWLACFQRASPRYAALILQARGATDAFSLDSGTSTTRAIGDKAKDMWSGTVIGGWRPVANCFGIKADPLP